MFLERVDRRGGAAVAGRGVGDGGEGIVVVLVWLVSSGWCVCCVTPVCVDAGGWTGGRVGVLVVPP